MSINISPIDSADREPEDELGAGFGRLGFFHIGGPHGWIGRIERVARITDLPSTYSQERIASDGNGMAGCNTAGLRH